LVDFHNATGQTVHLVRPPPTGRVYVHRLDDDTEYTLPASPTVIALADLESAAPRIATRGAAQEAFSLLFSLPFDRAVVDAYVPRADADDTAAAPLPLPRVIGEAPPRAGRVPLRTIVEWSALGVGVVALGAGAWFSASAIETSHGTTVGASQQAIAERDERISASNTRAGVAYAGGAVAVAVGVGAFFFWPSSVHVQVVATPQGGYAGYTGSF
jgi:hypothetical protein